MERRVFVKSGALAMVTKDLSPGFLRRTAFGIRQTSAPDLLLARATLTALKLAPAGDQTGGAGYLPLPEMVPVSEDVALAWLAALPKPVSCYSFIVLGITAIGWWQSLANSRRYAEAVEGNSEFLSMIKDRFERLRREPRLLVRSGGASVVLSLSEIAAWRSTYFVEFVDQRVIDADREARDAGADAILSCRRSDNSFISGVVRPS